MKSCIDRSIVVDLYLSSVRLPSHQHGVQHDAEAPHVGRPARVLGVGPQDLGAHVGRAAVLVREQVVLNIVQDHGVLQRLQLDLGPRKKRKPFKVGSFGSPLSKSLLFLSGRHVFRHFFK